jgi:MFS superfamily sulfate permease-like transporter
MKPASRANQLFFSTQFLVFAELHSKTYTYMKILTVPKDGLQGLRENWKADSLSGFLVFLLALPLSLGIAKASGFPAAMGVLTAMIGGLVVSIFQGGRLTIKGPAAGLITVCIAAVTELDTLRIDGASGVQLACGAIVVMAVIQFVFGILKFGSYSDFFPHSAVHGMLAAIGVLIFAKQFPVLLGVDSMYTKGLSPIQLFTHIPTFIQHTDPEIAAIGLTSLLIIFGLPSLGGVFKKIPSPIVVLAFMIPLGMALKIGESSPASLVFIGDFWRDVKLNASFSAIDTLVFWKYVLMFLFVNSLESLLTVKAIDGLDPFKRQSDYNKDLRALSIGNGLSGLLGGLPMISEVARSSANVSNGARTRWANFFHGLFLLVSMLVLIPVIEMIPTAALAAMLIAVAYRLASPKEFIGTYNVGPEQLVIFVVTIIVTVAEDLLVGVGAGILTKLMFHVVNGAPLKSLFKAEYETSEINNETVVIVRGAATFSNFIGYRKLWAKLDHSKSITFNFSNAKLVDHSFMERLHHFEEEAHAAGGKVAWVGLEKFSPYSNHPLAARRVGKELPNRMEIKLTPRQMELRAFAGECDFVYYPQRVRSAFKFRDFPIEKGTKILYEENILSKYTAYGKVDVSDIILTEGVRQAGVDTRITIAHVSDLEFEVPDFALEPEQLWNKLSALSSGHDIDFEKHPQFSRKFYLRSSDEPAVRKFFTEDVINFLETHDGVHLEVHRNKMLVYLKRDELRSAEIKRMIDFIEDLVLAVMRLEKIAV